MGSGLLKWLTGEGDLMRVKFSSYKALEALVTELRSYTKLADCEDERVLRRKYLLYQLQIIKGLGIETKQWIFFFFISKDLWFEKSYRLFIEQNYQEFLVNLHHFYTIWDHKFVQTLIFLAKFSWFLSIKYKISC